jgi:hypothetical protein
MKSGPKTQAEYLMDNVRIPGAREPAPKDLEPGAAALWNSIVVRLPADWFTSETIPLLKAYCRHSCFADNFAAQIVALRAELAELTEHGPSDEEDVDSVKLLVRKTEELHNVHRMHGYETEHAFKAATKLRLTNQSRFVPEKAASKARSALASGPPPWHDWGEQVSSEN